MGFLRRYQSEIYGQYRKSFLRDGFFTGLIISGVVLFCKLVFMPVNTPHSLVNDITLLVATLFFAYRYREKLPNKKVFFKELMIYGLGLGVVAAVVYGVFILFYGSLIDVEFPHRCMESFIANEQEGAASPEEKAHTIEVMRGYTIYTWGMIAAFLTAVMSILTAFIAALLFRTEQNVVRPPKNKKGK